jgi:hypothetical protein
VTPKSETFRWHWYIFDVEAMNNDIRLGHLTGVSVQLRRWTTMLAESVMLSLLGPSSASDEGPDFFIMSDDPRRAGWTIREIVFGVRTAL